MVVIGHDGVSGNIDAKQLGEFCQSCNDSIAAMTEIFIIDDTKQKSAPYTAADDMITGRSLNGHQRFTRHGHRVSLTVLVEGRYLLWLLKC